MALNTEYDIVKAFDAIEDELISSMIRNMKNHKLEEIDEDKEWSMWQSEQLKSLEKYRRNNEKKFGKEFKKINSKIDALIRVAQGEGQLNQEVSILKAIKNGFKGQKVSSGASAEFFRLNERKLEALIDSVNNDLQKAETAVLRMANDQYRQIIFNAQVYANTGAGTYEKAVDMATKDFLAAGLNCVEYSNGARHTLKDYADMAIRTASKRAYLQGEGTKRQEWGISTVIVNKRGNPCPKCLPFCGKVLIDDVWSGGSKKDGKYPLVSYAISQGLYHPRCKDSHTTYFPGISTADDTWTEKELEGIGIKSKQEAEKQYAKRQSEKFQRMSAYSLDSDNKKYYKQKSAEWKEKAERFTITDDIREHRQDTPKKMVDLIEQYSADEFVIINDQAESAFEYNPDMDIVEVNPRHPMFGTYDYRDTMIHEIAHRIDRNEFGSPMSAEFSNTIAKARVKILQDADKYNKLFDAGNVFEYNMPISDILGCITDNVVVGNACHDSQYIGIPGYTELEVFANLFSVAYQGDDASMNFVRTELDEVYQAFLAIIGE